MSESKLISEAEIERSTSAHPSVTYNLKGDGWHASYHPDSGNVSVFIDPLIPDHRSYHYPSAITFKLTESIELARVIPEIVRNILPLLMLSVNGSVNDKPTYMSKSEPVELKRLNGNGALQARVLPAITHERKVEPNDDKPDDDNIPF